MPIENPLLTADQLAFTPSRSNGISQSEELQLRILGCRFIRNAGTLLKVPLIVTLTSQALFQQFYYQRSLRMFSILDVGMATTFIACKVEESIRRLRDVINVFHFLYQEYRLLPTDPMPWYCEQYLDYKEGLVEAENIVLCELGFNVNVQHGHALLINYLKALDLIEERTFCQNALSTLNDLYLTDAFLRFQPNVVACASIYKSGKAENELLLMEGWWEIFDASLEAMESLCSALEAVYSEIVSGKLPVNHKELEDYYPLA